MKLKLFILLTLQLLSHPLVSANKPKDFPLCQPDHPEILCSYYVGDLHPTQTIIGEAEISCKRKRFNAMSHSELNKYIFDHPIPAVAGMDQLHITDHHHLSLALLQSDQDKDHKYVVINITESRDLSSLTSYSALYKMLNEMNLIWLYDNRGDYPINPLNIPSQLELLSNDPYRSLAYLIRCNGGYDKVDIPFQDFYWVNYLREFDLFPITEMNGICSLMPYNSVYGCDGHSDQAVFSMLERGIQLAISKGAKELPGYRSSVNPTAVCDCSL